MFSQAGIDVFSSPIIVWGYYWTLGASKGMQVSTQPFLLRRYARQVASDCKRLNRLRLGVYANSQVSLNFRPQQPMVDDSVNLAEVSVKSVRHNHWIKHLLQPRINADG